MAHPFVDQMRFTRSELVRALDGVSEDDALRRFGPMNSLGWIICHLAGQERRFWLIRAQGITDVAPELEEWGAWGQPANTPPLREAWQAWQATVDAVDPYLDTLDAEALSGYYPPAGWRYEDAIGTMLQRVILHYWYHLGEAMAIRQLLGHDGLPEFIGPLGDYAPYRRE